MYKELAKLLNAYIHCGKEKAMADIQHLYDELKPNAELGMLLDKPKFVWELPPPPPAPEPNIDANVLRSMMAEINSL